MASLAFGVLALPENVLAIRYIGRWLARKIRVYRDAPKVLEDLKKFGVDLYKGQFYLDIGIAYACKNDITDPALREQIDRQIKQLMGGLERAQRMIAESFDEKEEINKLRFTLSVEEPLRENLEKMRLWQADFRALIDNWETHHRRWREMMNLSHRTFMPTVMANGHYCRRVPGTSHAYHGDAEWKDSYEERQYTPILFERHDLRQDLLDQVKETLIYLAVHLPKQTKPEMGILRCLGYREKPEPELVFEIPSTYPGRPRTLRGHLQRYGSRSNGGVIPKSMRFEIAQRMSAAIWYAQRIGIVHKHVRPDSILMFKELQAQNGIPDSQSETWRPFLTNWTLARTEQMLSSRQGDKDWRHNLYRHPQRQGLHIEERYHAGHDIYSLGVCLLECGLGESLILSTDDDDDEANLCEIFQAKAVRLGFITDCRRLSPDRYQEILYD